MEIFGSLECVEELEGAKNKTIDHVELYSGSPVRIYLTDGTCLCISDYADCGGDYHYEVWWEA